MGYICLTTQSHQALFGHTIWLVSSSIPLSSHITWADQHRLYAQQEQATLKLTYSKPHYWLINNAVTNSTDCDNAWNLAVKNLDSISSVTPQLTQLLSWEHKPSSGSAPSPSVVQRFQTIFLPTSGTLILLQLLVKPLRLTRFTTDVVMHYRPKCCRWAL